jgi:hypothetical protein
MTLRDKALGGSLIGAGLLMVLFAIVYYLAIAVIVFGGALFVLKHFGVLAAVMLP